MNDRIGWAAVGLVVGAVVAGGFGLTAYAGEQREISALKGEIQDVENESHARGEEIKLLDRKLEDAESQTLNWAYQACFQYGYGVGWGSSGDADAAVDLSLEFCDGDLAALGEERFIQEWVPVWDVENGENNA